MLITKTTIKFANNSLRTATKCIFKPHKRTAKIFRNSKISFRFHLSFCSYILSQNLRMTMSNRDGGDSSKHVQVSFTLVIPQPLHSSFVEEQRFLVERLLARRNASFPRLQNRLVTGTLNRKICLSWRESDLIKINYANGRVYLYRFLN